MPSSRLVYNIFSSIKLLCVQFSISSPVGFESSPKRLKISTQWTNRHLGMQSIVSPCDYVGFVVDFVIWGIGFTMDRVWLP